MAYGTTYLSRTPARRFATMVIGACVLTAYGAIRPVTILGRHAAPPGDAVLIVLGAGTVAASMLLAHYLRPAATRGVRRLAASLVILSNMLLIFLALPSHSSGYLFPPRYQLFGDGVMVALGLTLFGLLGFSASQRARLRSGPPTAPAGTPAGLSPVASSASSASGPQPSLTISDPATLARDRDAGS